MPRVRRHLIHALLLLVAAATARAGESGVRITVGPTPIPGGTAQGAADITLVNERLAVAFAVDTAGPWGVARGGVVDVAEVRDGAIAPDRASLFDFMPNDWSGWPNTYHRVIVEKDTPAEAVLRTERDWGDVQLVTTWTLRAGEDTLHARTRMSNRGTQSMPDLLSGYVLWPEGGYLFGVPGAHTLTEGRVELPLAQWSAAYDRDWAMGLHAPFADRVGDDARDRYLQHSLDAGATREFEAWLQVVPRGELAPLVATEIAREGLPSAQIDGEVRTAAGTVAAPVVIAEALGAKGARPYTWTVGNEGRYALRLPAGRYRVYATAAAHADSTPREIDLRPGAALRLDFTDLQPPGELQFAVEDGRRHRPLDARIDIEAGRAPLVRYLGSNSFFTGLAPRGRAVLRIAPGDYRFRVDSGAGFRAPPLFVNARVVAGSRQQIAAPVEVLADPAAEGWYCGDLHHHSDVLDGFTPPAFVLRSQLAAGLDLAFLSDHDSIANNREMQRLATERGVPFIAASEFSPSWAHFNGYPLDEGADIGIDVGRSTVQQIFAEARRMGARVVAVNHPYINYGYFRSVERNEVPGGYSAAYDLVEVNGTDANRETVEHLWRLWSAGQKVYLTAGSDAHDVWQEPSGTARMCVQLTGGLDAPAFVSALKAGHGYATQGPLVFPAQPFGDTLHHRSGAALALDFEVQAVNGLASVQLIEHGAPVQEQRFDGATRRTPVRFEAQPAGSTWYSLVVTDARGRQAWTNPLWVESAGP